MRKADITDGSNRERHPRIYENAYPYRRLEGVDRDPGRRPPASDNPPQMTGVPTERTNETDSRDASNRAMPKWHSAAAAAAAADAAARRC